MPGCLQQCRVENALLENLLAYCNLRGYLLSLPNGTGFFAPGENVYSAVVDGDYLIASTPANVALV
jgi:hypothetical protein